MDIDIVNEALCSVATPEKLCAIGFIQKDDGSGDPRGIWWEYTTENFLLMLDCVMVVKLYRRNPDSDEIVVYIPDLFSLERVIDWISEEER